MKTNIAFTVMLATQLAGCSAFERHQTDNASVSAFESHQTDERQPPVTQNLQDALNIKITNGAPVVLDENGVIISKRVKMPIDISTFQSIESIQELLIITLKGSCDVLIGSGGDYVETTLRDDHPCCINRCPGLIYLIQQ